MVVDFPMAVGLPALASQQRQLCSLQLCRFSGFVGCGDSRVRRPLVGKPTLWWRVALSATKMGLKM